MEINAVGQGKWEGNLLPGEGWFNLRDSLDRFRGQFGALAKAKGIFLEITISAETPSYFAGDSLLIHELLANLASFAFDHLDDGGIFINVHAYPVRQNRYRLDFTLTTTGAGIPAARLQRIFQPVHSGCREGHNSLYVAKTIASLMKGDVAVENTFGWGARYHTHLIMKGDAPPCHEHLPPNKKLPQQAILYNNFNMQ